MNNSKDLYKEYKDQIKLEKGLRKILGIPNEQEKAKKLKDSIKKII